MSLEVPASSPESLTYEGMRLHENASLVGEALARWRDLAYAIATGAEVTIKMVDSDDYGAPLLMRFDVGELYCVIPVRR